MVSEPNVGQWSFGDFPGFDPGVHLDLGSVLPVLWHALRSRSDSQQNSIQFPAVLRRLSMDQPHTPLL